MNKQEYINTLRQELEGFPHDFAADILNDYEEHFKMGLASGKTEEQICEELGDIHSFVRELREAEPDLQGSKFIPAVSDTTGADTSGNTQTGSNRPDDNCYLCKRIEAKLSSTNIRVMRSNDSFVHVEYKENSSLDQKLHSRLVCEQRGDTLYLRQIKNPAISQRHLGLLGFASVLVSFSRNDSTLYLMLPDDFPEAFLQTASGDIFLEQVGLHKLTLSTASGDIKSDHIQAEELSLETASGDTLLENSQARIFKGQQKSGDLELSRCRIHSAQISSVSGDIDGESNQFGEMKLFTASGSISLNGTLSRLNAKTASGDIDLEVQNTAAPVITAATASGDVDIRLYYSAGLNTTLRSVSGDVRVHYRDLKYQVSSLHGQPLKLSTGVLPAQVEIETVSGDITVEGA